MLQARRVISKEMNRLLENAMSLLARFRRNQNGATAIEYGLIAGLVSIVIVAALMSVGTDLSALYGSVADKLAGAK